MLKLVFEKKFKKDYKRVSKQGKPMDLLDDIMKLIAKGEKLPKKKQDHPLSGNWKGARECHIAPDWLLIYYLAEDKVFFSRTGSHSELLEKG